MLPPVVHFQELNPLHKGHGQALLCCPAGVWPLSLLNSARCADPGSPRNRSQDPRWDSVCKNFIQEHVDLTLVQMNSQCRRKESKGPMEVSHTVLQSVWDYTKPKPLGFLDIWMGQLYLVRGSSLRHEQVTDSEAEHPCPSFLTKPGARNWVSDHIFHQLFLWSVGPLGDTKCPGRHGSALTAHFGLRRKPKGFGFV